MRHLVVVLGDQLDPAASVLEDFDPQQDAVWMAESGAEARRVWSHKARIALFLAAMRHHAQALRQRGYTVHYLQSPDRSLIDLLAATLQQLRPAAVLLHPPGEWGLRAGFQALAARCDVPFIWRQERHFLCSEEDFAGWMQGRRQPRMEHFYRWMRGRCGWLVEADGSPRGGQWNFDADNRKAFGPQGPGLRPEPLAFPPDALTREVLETVARDYADHPGALEAFDWPVTRAQSLQALQDFIQNRLPQFGDYQDALWQGEPWPRRLLFHSRLSAALNLKLLDPREVCQAALAALDQGLAPLAAVEGFIRQILGWREYVRGLYWHRMPAALQDNALQARQALPAFYWTARTDLNCLHQTLRETLESGYAHHIQRLMVTGLYALLLGVDPRQLHQWYLAIYVDAVEWVELPNTMGMSQYADGGVLASKPYIASGKYLQRMGNYCDRCRYRPDQALGPSACPFTPLYWDLLDRHEARFAGHPRMKLQVQALRRKPQDERLALREAAARLREGDGLPCA